MYNAKDVANYMIYKSETINVPIDYVKLQKALYYVQANFLLKKKIPCFKDTIHASSTGPVIYSLIDEYSKYGFNPIPKQNFKPSKITIKEEDKKLIDEILLEALTYSKIDLIRLTTHQLPYKKAMMRTEKNFKNEDIKRYFEIHNLKEEDKVKKSYKHKVLVKKK